MNGRDVLIEAFDRLPELVHGAVDGLAPGQLGWRPAPTANPIGWLVWHLTRVQDHHVAELLAEDQIWVKADWAKRFGLKPDPDNTGYGHTVKETATVRADARGLIDYYETVHARTRKYLQSLTASDLDQVVDTRWDPPVTLGVRLVSIVNDDTQHVGQAAYVRGLLA